MTRPERGKVWLVGAGPGDADLITLRGAEVLRSADAVVHDALVSPELLELAPPHAQRINVGKRGHAPPTRPQPEIHTLLIRLAREGKRVVRLKGGDPFIFGRGGEEASALLAAGIPVEVVPGVSSALAAPALAGIPLTDRRYSASFAVVTGHRDALRPWTSIRWDRLATGPDTLVILMGMSNLEKIVAELLEHGRAADTPAAVVMSAGTPEQRVLEAPLAELPRAVREHGFAAPAVVVVGDVVRLRRELAAGPRPLAGWRVLVTRAAEQAGSLCDALREAGAEPRVAPLIRIRRLPESEALRRALGELEHYDALLFTSANAVRIFAERARARGVALGSLPLEVFCVGEASAEAAREVGIAAPRTPRVPADAEALAAAVERELSAAGRRFLWPTAEVPREALARALEAAGARVDAVAVYSTEPAPLDAPALRRALVEGELDALTFSSPSTVRAFAAILDDEARRAAHRCVIAAIGRVTAEALREAGLEAHVVAASPGARALVAALAAVATRAGAREET